MGLLDGGAALGIFNRLDLLVDLLDRDRLLGPNWFLAAGLLLSFFVHLFVFLSAHGLSFFFFVVLNEHKI